MDHWSSVTEVISVIQKKVLKIMLNEYNPWIAQGISVLCWPDYQSDFYLNKIVFFGIYKFLNLTGF